MKSLKAWLPDVVAVVLFAVVSLAYFFPADIEGRILYRHDSSAGRGAGEEMNEYHQRTGERTRWTNALFGGMPTYQMAPSYNSTTVLSQAANAYHLWLPDIVWYVFAYLLGFYILLRAFDFRWYLAMLGAVIWAFSSYFFIIIAAGHYWKVMALAYLPPMIAGVVLAFRGRYLWGLVVTAVFNIEPFIQALNSLITAFNGHTHGNNGAAAPVPQMQQLDKNGYEDKTVTH